MTIEPGRALGPIRLGMSEAEVQGLGLEAGARTFASQRFGPYLVTFEDGVVDRVEARIGDLSRVRVGDEIIEAGTHIHQIRDRVGDCEWREGGGERYECRRGELWLYTAHSLDPMRYTFALER